MGKTSDNQKKIIYFLAVIVLAFGVKYVLSIRDEPVRTTDESPDIYIKGQVSVDSIRHRGSIAIIIDDFGYRNDKVSEGFLKIDASLTYAIIPGHEYSQSFSSRAKQKGYEVIVHMPFESRFKTKGEREYILETDMTSEELEIRINKVLRHLPEAVGMNNHQGSKTSADKRVMGILASILKRNGKYFIDSRTTKETVAEVTMRNHQVPTNRRHVFLDNQDNIDLIKTQLKELIQKAEILGVAVGIGHAKEKNPYGAERNDS